MNKKLFIALITAISLSISGQANAMLNFMRQATLPTAARAMHSNAHTPADGKWILPSWILQRFNAVKPAKNPSFECAQPTQKFASPFDEIAETMAKQPNLTREKATELFKVIKSEKLALAQEQAQSMATTVNGLEARLETATQELTSHAQQITNLMRRATSLRYQRNILGLSLGVTATAFASYVYAEQIQQTCDTIDRIPEQTAEYATGQTNNLKEYVADRIHEAKKWLYDRVNDTKNKLRRTIGDDWKLDQIKTAPIKIAPVKTKPDTVAQPQGKAQLQKEQEPAKVTTKPNIVAQPEVETQPQEQEPVIVTTPHLPPLNMYELTRLDPVWWTENSAKALQELETQIK